MKKYIRIAVTLILLGSITIQAGPFKTWGWTDPTTYENGQPIPAGDLITRTIKCGTTAGGPYPDEAIFMSQSPPSAEDMAFVVNGIPGNYFCVSTVWSLAYMSESGVSNEVPFTVAPGAVGFVPNPMTLTLQ